jgi:hypothetical protein
MPPNGRGRMPGYPPRAALPFIRRIIMRHLHAVPTCLLALTLIAPFGWVFFLQESTDSCDMSCCRGSRCCCHKVASSNKNGDFEWNAAPACGSDCARHIGLTGLLSGTLIAACIKVGTAPETESHQNPSKSATFHSGTEFALFGRPPPTCS